MTIETDKVRDYNFFEIQDLGEDGKWRRFRQSKNEIELPEAQAWARAEIEKEKEYNRNLRIFIDLPFPINWRLVKVFKRCVTVEF